jgi:cytochrome P450
VHRTTSTIGVDVFAAKEAALFTTSHHTHKARRQPLSPLFSNTKVTSRQDLIHRHLDKLCRRLSKFSEAGTRFDLGPATTAFARDVANDFILGKSNSSLEREDFDVAMLAASQGSGQVWRLAKFVRWVAPTMQSVPISWIMKMAGQELNTFFRHLQVNGSP